MDQSQIRDHLQTHLGSAPGFSAHTADTLSGHLAAAIATAGAPGQPSPAQQACYQQCEATKEAALAMCAAKGFPAAWSCAAAAILAYNACRHQCDQNAGGATGS